MRTLVPPRLPRVRVGPTLRSHGNGTGHRLRRDGRVERRAARPLPQPRFRGDREPGLAGGVVRPAGAAARVHPRRALAGAAAGAGRAARDPRRAERRSSGRRHPQDRRAGGVGRPVPGARPPPQHRRRAGAHPGAGHQDVPQLGAAQAAGSRFRQGHAPGLPLLADSAHGAVQLLVRHRRGDGRERLHGGDRRRAPGRRPAPRARDRRLRDSAGALRRGGQDAGADAGRRGSVLPLPAAACHGAESQRQVAPRHRALLHERPLYPTPIPAAVRSTFRSPVPPSPAA